MSNPKQLPHPEPPQPPGWYRDPDDPRRKRYWDGQQWTEHEGARAIQPAMGLFRSSRQSFFGLPLWGVIAAVTAVVVVVLVGVVVIVFSGGGHSQSWEYGYRHVDSAITLVNLNTSPDYACRQVAIIGTAYEFDGGKSRNYAEIEAGCRAALKDRGY